VAWNTDIYLRSVPSPSTDIVLYALAVAPIASTDIYLSALAVTPTDIVLRDTTVAPGGGSFPTQFSGLRTFYAGGMVELCLVATADANTGNQLRLRKGATTYCVYLVDTSDPQASNVRIETTAGTKAVRVKT